MLKYKWKIKKKEINKNKDRNWIDNLRVAPILSVKARLSAKLLVWKIFHIRPHANKTHLHQRDFALSLVLKVRVFVAVGKEEKIGQQRKASSGLQLACPNLSLLISSPASCRFPIWPPYRKTRKPWGRCCQLVSWRTMANEKVQTPSVGFASFALISREFFFARDVKSSLLRFCNWRPFRNFKGMVVFSRSIHHGT